MTLQALDFFIHLVDRVSLLVLTILTTNLTFVTYKLYPKIKIQF